MALSPYRFSETPCININIPIPYLCFPIFNNNITFLSEQHIYSDQFSVYIFYHQVCHLSLSREATLSIHNSVQVSFILISLTIPTHISINKLNVVLFWGPVERVRSSNPDLSNFLTFGEKFFVLYFFLSKSLSKLNQKGLETIHVSFRSTLILLELKNYF